MAKLKMPLLSGTASGKLGKKLVFSMRNNISQSRNFHYPKKAPSGEQLAQRYIIGLLTARWQTMTTAEKAPYNAGAVASEKKNGKPLTGFNYWIKMAMSDLPTHYGMIAFYPMNEGSGRLVKDYSGNELHLTMQPPPPASTLLWVDSANSKFGKCLEGDGNIKYASHSTSTLYNVSSKFSFACWVFVEEKSVADRYMFSRAGVFNFLKNSADLLSFGLNINGTMRYLSFQSARWTPGRWYLFCMTYDANGGASNYKIFQNGRFYLSASYTGNITNANNPLYVFSRSTTLSMWKGKLDNLLFVNRVLSSDEIFKIYNLMAVDKERQNLP